MESRRNGLAGTKNGTSKSAKYYHEHPEANKKKNEAQSKRNKSKRNKIYRACLNRANKLNKNSTKGDGMDMSHTKRGLRLKPQSKNRGSKTDSPGDKRARG